MVTCNVQRVDRTLPALALACTLLLSGCSLLGAPGSPGSNPASVTPSATLSPAPVVEYPPGLYGSAVTGPFALADAHGRSLAGHAYTVVERRVIRYRNGTLYTSRVERTRTAADEPRYRYTRTVRGMPRGPAADANTTVVLASNGTVVARKVVRGTRTDYVLVAGPDGKPTEPAFVYHGSPRNRERVAVAFDRAANVTVARASDSTYRLRATATPDDTFTVTTGTVRNVGDFALTATVTESGFVREYRLTLRGTLDGHPVTVVEHVRYSAVGNTTVELPAWWDRAVGDESGV